MKEIDQIRVTDARQKCWDISHILILENILPVEICGETESCLEVFESSEELSGDDVERLENTEDEKRSPADDEDGDDKHQHGNDSCHVRFLIEFLLFMTKTAVIPDCSSSGFLLINISFTEAG